MRGFRFSVIIALLIGAACSTTDDVKPLTERDIAGRVVLESYEVDLTWGYRMRGMYVVGDGTVWSYEYSGAPWYPERLKTGELSARDMLSKHKDAVQIGTVDRRGLLDVAQMIRRAAKGEVVRTTGANQGKGRLEVAYLFDDKPSTYREVVLAGSGDKAATNNAAAAGVLLAYLREVQQAVGWSW